MQLAIALKNLTPTPTPSIILKEKGHQRPETPRESPTQVLMIKEKLLLEMHMESSSCFSFFVSPSYARRHDQSKRGADNSTTRAPKSKKALKEAAKKEAEKAARRTTMLSNLVYICKSYRRRRRRISQCAPSPTS
ncbi:hypothetical protein RUND412_000292 [Rhizina undulata]